MGSRSVKQKCPQECDGDGTCHGDNGGDESEMYPLYEVLWDCPVCGNKPAIPPTAAKENEYGTE